MTTNQPVSAVLLAIPDLPESRRAKKRELDRRAQRAARERNKNRIAYLEATIQAMSENEQNGKIAGLMSQLSDMTRQRDNLVRTLSSMETTIQIDREINEVEDPPMDQATQTLSSPSQSQNWLSGCRVSDAFSLDMADVAVEFSTPGTMTMAWSLPVHDTAGSGIATETDLPTYVPAQSSLTLARHPSIQPLPNPLLSHSGGSSVILPEPGAVCECSFSIQDPESPIAFTKSIWRSANEALSGCDMLQEYVKHGRAMVDDFPPRVIIEGWEAVERLRELPPLCERLRRIDTLQFSNCPDTERLAILG
ncbi:uncharacterized protein ColSpa_03098 [Colletotrichum spaethianum]|uniref:BZIP domain-containing protein n=1 Tax=Colletotrichum spaethianum TaxID=700344 RepID=A0AA37L6U1_9PEZI|nr:uncharacterized protein ColSpa_03098 [Colletotrichum spaethianum]GKT42917.1 hypothetical protein ColSpa_03098 [Colletotrichum spaethianum]